MTRESDDPLPNGKDKISNATWFEGKSNFPSPA